MNTVLCVDDKEEELQTLRYQLADHYRVIPCRDARAAASAVAKNKPAAVLLDIEMPVYDGFKVLSEIRAMPAPPPVLMLSAHQEPFFVVNAMRKGAADFFSKPYNGTMLRLRLDRIIPAEGAQPSVRLPKDASIASRLLAGSSAAMATVRATLAAYAKSDAPVLILGESGTGKDRAARIIHALSPRSAGPFEIRNVGALPETIAESELFGCERGAFTDARDRPGCFEAAHGGTLFLDEIAEASHVVQAALLRVVEDGIVRKLGSTKHTKADCRLVFATNGNLEAAAAAKTFREDLLYRINTLPLVIPPLRDRREDIPELVELFLTENGLQADAVEPTALEYLVDQRWPGNVRQLRACIERAVVLSGGVANGGPLRKRIGIESLAL